MIGRESEKEYREGLDCLVSKVGLICVRGLLTLCKQGYVRGVCLDGDYQLSPLNVRSSCPLISSVQSTYTLNPRTHDVT